MFDNHEWLLSPQLAQARIHGVRIPSQTAGRQIHYYYPWGVCEGVCVFACVSSFGLVPAEQMHTHPNTNLRTWRYIQMAGFSSPPGKKVHRSPGDRWMLNGPMDYIPPIEVGAFETRWARRPFTSHNSGEERERAWLCARCHKRCSIHPTGRQYH